MPRRADSSRLQRLDELAALLRADDLLTVGELAERLGVSQRTLTRDLELLRERGLPIDASIGRGGGIRLHRHWSVGRATLSYLEAIDLLVALAMADKLGSSVLFKHVNPVRNKLALTFSPAERERIKLLRRRILVGAQSTPAVLATLRPASPRVTSPVQQAFFEMQKLEMEYEDQNLSRTLRTVEPHYLLLCWPAWYLLAWDELRGDVRSFRIDRIATAQVAGTKFKLRPEKTFAPAIAGIGEPI